MSIRPVKRLIKSQATLEGPSVHLRRAFGFGNTKAFDPLRDAFSTDTSDTVFMETPSSSVNCRNGTRS